jgi:uncharacterized protein (DUF58 family)
VIGTRAYVAGDPVSTIDWPATARLSATSGRDEFVVRDRSADEAPRVVVVCDRRPAMGIFPPGLPWLQKARAVVEAGVAIAASASAARSDVASLDLAGGDPYWLPPGRRDRAWLLAERFGDETPFDAPDDNLELAFEFLGGLRRDLPPGTFVFVLSDFLVTPAPGAWSAAVAHGWDVVPVVVQDPVWERSFPPVGGVTVPVADPRSGRVSLVRFTARSAEQRRLANEERWQALLTELRAVGLDPVELASATPDEVDRTFVTWAEARRLGRWEH